MSNTTNPLTQLALAPITAQVEKSAKKGTNGFFEALSQAWGEALDRQAQAITDKSAQISAGDNTPGTLTELSALSMQFGFESNAAHTSQSSVSSALETIARKQ